MGERGSVSQRRASTPSQLCQALQQERTPQSPWILGLKALGLRSKVCWIECCLTLSCAWLLLQSWQLHSGMQVRPAAKHSQYLKHHITRGHMCEAKQTMNRTPSLSHTTYSFKHLDFLQLQGVRRMPAIKLPPLASLASTRARAAAVDAFVTAGFAVPLLRDREAAP